VRLSYAKKPPRKGVDMSKIEFKVEVEYKVVKLPMKGVFTKDVSPDLENVLNSEGKDGWRLVNSIVSASGFGESDKVVLILMRPK
jgi:hypothetical protein